MLAYAAEEAERLQNKHIGTEHKLLGLLREKDAFAAQLLNSQGLSLDGAREIVNKSGKRAGLVPALLEIADRVFSSSSLAGKEDPIVLVPD